MYNFMRSQTSKCSKCSKTQVISYRSYPKPRYVTVRVHSFFLKQRLKRKGKGPIQRHEKPFTTLKAHEPPRKIRELLFPNHGGLISRFSSHLRSPRIGSYAKAGKLASIKHLLKHLHDARVQPFPELRILFLSFILSTSFRVPSSNSKT